MSKHLPFLAVLIAFVILAVSFSLVNPLHEATDEIRHYRYVRYLLDYHRLPVQEPDQPRSQSHHPPLYYALAALASSWVQPDQPLYANPPANPHWGYRYWEVGVDNKNQYVHGAGEAFPYRGDVLIAHIARLVNVLLGACVVILSYYLGRLVFADRPAVALGGLAFVAFNPMFLYMSGAINNDVAAAAGGAAVVAACARLMTTGLTRRRAAALGLVYGLALMAKFNLAFILVLIELTLLVEAWKRRSMRQLLWANLAVLGGAALVSGWWFVRNQVLYGEPTGFERMTDLWGMRDPRTSLPLALFELPYAWSSLWGRFGYGQIPMPDGVYTGLGLVAGAGGLGLVLRAVQLWRARADQACSPGHLGLLAACVLSFGGVLFGYMLLSPAGAMGRFFFPALPALGLCMFYGLSAWLPSRWTTALATACLAAMAALSLYALLGILRPAYERPSPLSNSQIASIQRPAQLTLGSQARLLGYDLETTPLQPGDELAFTVYWQALAPAPEDLTVFVHLLSQAGPMVAQRDTYPGLGRFPASSWQSGDTFSDRYRIVLDPYTYAPDVVDVVVGLYTPDGGRLPVTDADGRTVGTGVTLTQITLTPLAGPYPNPTHVNFEDYIALVGYSLSARSAPAGQPLTLTLYWQALAPMEYEYQIFAQLVGEDYQRWAANDGFPNTSPKRTWRWSAGQVYTDTRVLAVAPDTPPGIYPLHLGWFGGPNHERLFVLADSGIPTSDYVVLTQIRVTELP
ncbi:MAG: phospholipid carrier-dependent glycosyltransferase [Thermoflexales bacterium]|nr:phospholipid carrier-dependent glycosyltransferase [Thermoflexales bacterium]